MRFVYDNVTSASRFDLEHIFDCIRGMAQFSASFSQLSDADFQTAELQNIAVELLAKFKNDGTTATGIVESYTTEITTAAAKIEIGYVITKFSENLCDVTGNVFSQESTTDGNVRGDVHMFEATNMQSVTLSSWMLTKKRF